MIENGPRKALSPACLTTIVRVRLETHSFETELKLEMVGDGEDGARTLVGLSSSLLVSLLQFVNYALRLPSLSPTLAALPFPTVGIDGVT